MRRSRTSPGGREGIREPFGESAWENSLEWLIQRKVELSYTRLDFRTGDSAVRLGLKHIRGRCSRDSMEETHNFHEVIYDLYSTKASDDEYRGECIFVE